MFIRKQNSNECIERETTWHGNNTNIICALGGEVAASA